MKFWYSLLLLIAIKNLRCRLTVDRETAVEGTVLLTTGEPVANFPLTVAARKQSILGGGEQVSQEDFQTNKLSTFFYRGVMKSGPKGLVYQLMWPYRFQIYNQVYVIDSVQAHISADTMPNRVKFDGYFLAWSDHAIRITLRKE